MSRPTDEPAGTDYSRQNAELDAAQQRYKLPAAEQEYIKLDDAYNLNSAQSFASNAQAACWTAAKPVGALLQSTDAIHIIDDRLHGFADSIPVFIRALDEVGKLHPFIGVAVLAFKAVYTLEIARVENDKKIKLLYLEMKDMMSVLLRLKDITDIKNSRDTLQNLAEDTSITIKKCANACDAYSKKKQIVKFVKGPIWVKRFADFTGFFAEKREQFAFELTLLSSEGSKKVLDLQKICLDKVTTMTEVFQTLIAPEQAELQKLGIVESGSPNKALIKQLLKDHPQFKLAKSTSESRSQAGKSEPDKKDIDDVLEDLRSSSDSTKKDEDKNNEYFERKFNILARQMEEVKDLVVHETDRTINAINAGPHERINDQDIYTVWKEGGWKGSVKARHFVLALRDYYQENVEDRKRTQEPRQFMETGPDDWALTYINIPYLQPILEAFDDDASGFITISEVTRFIAAQPTGWSLQRWLAFWAIGWYAYTITEIWKIKELFGKMFGMLPKILPDNRILTDRYLTCTWKAFYEVIAAVEHRTVPFGLRTRFASYVEAEEKRLQANLDSIQYNIDGLDALNLVTGPGRIEKHFFLLVRLMLEHHLKVFHIAKTKLLNTMELIDAEESFDYIMQAVSYRYNDLKTIFLNQNQDPKQQFKAFSYGFYKYIHEPPELWTTAIKDHDFEEYNETYEDSAIDPEEITLFYQDIDIDIDIDYPPYGEAESYSTIIAKVHAPGVHPLSGKWAQLLYGDEGEEARIGRIMEYSIIPDEPAVLSGRFQCTGKTDTGEILSGFGSCEEQEESGQLVVRFEFWGSSDTTSKYYMSGTFDPDSDSITGNFGDDEDSLTHKGYFILKRTPGEILRFRPAPVVLRNNKAKGLWTFAKLAVLEQVRRDLWSWSYFKNRRDIREAYITLYSSSDIREEKSRKLNELCELVAPRDAEFYKSLLQLKLRRLSYQLNYACDACDDEIGNDRITCLDCESTESLERTVDFCGEQSCLEATKFPRRSDLAKPHTRMHDIVKMRKTVFAWQYPKLKKEAKERIKWAHLKLVRRDEEERERKTTDNGNTTEHVEAEAMTMTTPDVPAPTVNCAICQKNVKPPCWYCIDCKSHLFICVECDKDGGFKREEHEKDHTLVRCLESHVDHDAENSTAGLTEHVLSLGSDIQRMNDRLLQVEKNIQAINEKQECVESMLRTVLNSQRSATAV